MVIHAQQNTKPEQFYRDKQFFDSKYIIQSSKVQGRSLCLFLFIISTIKKWWDRTSKDKN
jgi:hypothetical protein